MKIELTDKDIEIILRALGHEKASAQEAGFYILSHSASALQAHIKNQLPVSA